MPERRKSKPLPNPEDIQVNVNDVSSNTDPSLLLSPQLEDNVGISLLNPNNLNNATLLPSPAPQLDLIETSPLGESLIFETLNLDSVNNDNNEPIIDDSKSEENLASESPISKTSVKTFVTRQSSRSRQSSSEESKGSEESAEVTANDKQRNEIQNNEEDSSILISGNLMNSHLSHLLVDHRISSSEPTSATQNSPSNIPIPSDRPASLKDTSHTSNQSISSTFSTSKFPVVNIIKSTPRESTNGPLSAKQRLGFMPSPSFENLQDIHEISAQEDTFKSPSNKSFSTKLSTRDALSPATCDLKRKTSIRIDVPGGYGSGPIRMEIFPQDIAITPSRQTIGPNLERLRTMNSAKLSKRDTVLLHQHLNPPHALPLLKDKKDFGIWSVIVMLLTFYIPTIFIKKCGKMKDPKVIRAWREKVALCTIFLILCGILGFITYGFNETLCVQHESFDVDSLENFGTLYAHSFVFQGNVYDFSSEILQHQNYPSFQSSLDFGVVDYITGAQATSLFYTPSNPPPTCEGLMAQTPPDVGCYIQQTIPAYAHCHTWQDSYRSNYKGPVIYKWNQIKNNPDLVVYRGDVLNIAAYKMVGNSFLGNWADKTFIGHGGTDMTSSFSGTPVRVQLGNCLRDLYKVGRVEYISIGCFVTQLVLYCSLAVILLLVFFKFFMAIYFSWFMSRKLGRLREENSKRINANGAYVSNSSLQIYNRKKLLELGVMPFPLKAGLVATDSNMATMRKKTRRVSNQSGVSMNGSDTSATDNSANSDPYYAPLSFNPLNGPVGIPVPQIEKTATAPEYSTQMLPSLQNYPPLESMNRLGDTESPASSVGSLDIIPQRNSPYGLEVYTILLVTCYSEDEAGIRTTLDSLSNTNYSDNHKLIFIVADGIITGAGNEKSTPQTVIDMLELDENWPSPPTPVSYLSLAEGTKHHNMAQVYVGWYNYKDRTVPTVIVVKCGTEEEREGPKPGNRGKRDSQIILMSFFQKITFDDLMSPLDYDLFQKMHYLMGVTPDNFEIILMVDADTKVAPDSLARMVASMVSDPLVMGLCGETRIANKSDSWVSRIQVYEYYLSHHQTKAFESVFGSVTCLPGCFCMYRIKAPLEGGYWVPILANPDIVKTYSENRVDTLHKKNLLLLGEDRFLTTLMLGTFPHRKLMFVPKAFCKTVVPNEFKILLSQRRRWINSTVHNLFELLLVRKLCGVFCFSMQGVILLELFGTVTLPAAICFTIVLIIMSFVQKPVQIIPLCLLAAVLLLPAVLILLTCKRRVYIYWMGVYLLSLPVWNFVLPSYAFWHFDDFSWGATRKVDGEGKDKGHGSDDATANETYQATLMVPKKRWVDWETERRKCILIEYHREKEDNLYVNQ